jgi:predicted RNA-binding protein with PIN domain
VPLEQWSVRRRSMCQINLVDGWPLVGAWKELSGIVDITSRAWAQNDTVVEHYYGRDTLVRSFCSR